MDWARLPGEREMLGTGTMMRCEGLLPTVSREFLVVGAGRSGTKYVACLLRSLGLDVGHEELGSQGIVSWYLAADSEAAPHGPGSSHLSFAHVFHQVRHPLRVIPSMATFRADTWSFVAQHTRVSAAEPLLQRCANLWLRWNEMAEAKAEWRYRIEDVPLIYEEFCERFGVPCDRQLLEQLPRDINTRPPRLESWHYRLESRTYLRSSRKGTCLRPLLLSLGGAAAKPTLTWAELDHLCPDVARRIRSKAREYGYDD